MGVNYTRQYTFPDLRGEKYPLRFDFAVLNENHKLKFLLEYQGAAHFSNVFDVSEDEYQFAIDRDAMKREYCKTHNIPLYEFNKNTNLEEELRNLLCA